MLPAPRTIRASEIAELLAAELSGDPARLAGLVIDRATTLGSIESGAVFFSKRMDDRARTCLDRAPDGLALLPLASEGVAYPHVACKSPRHAFARVLTAFFQPLPVPGISATAVVHPSARIGDGVAIGPFVVVGQNAEIGADTEIRNNVTIGRNVKIGRRCLIKSNTVIGEEGFGIVPDEDGNNYRIPHLGSVVIGDNVEIGALNTVCSGTIDPTTVGDFVKTDDHVHIGHNVIIGRNAVITACSEISGSVTVGEDVWLGPNCSIMNGIEIGASAFIGLGAVVSKSVGPRSVMGGHRAVKLRER